MLGKRVIFRARDEAHSFLEYSGEVQEKDINGILLGDVNYNENGNRGSLKFVFVPWSLIISPIKPDPDDEFDDE